MLLTSAGAVGREEWSINDIKILQDCAHSRHYDPLGVEPLWKFPVELARGSIAANRKNWCPLLLVLGGRP